MTPDGHRSELSSNLEQLRPALWDVLQAGWSFDDNSGVFGGGVRTLLLANNPDGEPLSLAAAPVHLRDRVKSMGSISTHWEALPDGYATSLSFCPFSPKATPPTSTAVSQARNIPR